MVKIGFKPGNHSGEFKEGISLFDAADQLGIEIETLCGNKGICGKCKVIIEDGQENLSPPTKSEKNLLSKEEREDGYRLSCMAKAEKGFIQVRVPQGSLRKQQVVLAGGQEIEFEKNPTVQSYPLRMPKPTLKDSTADYERIGKYLKREYDVRISDIDHLALKELSGVLRKEQDSESEVWNSTIILWNDEEIIDAQPKHRKRILGLAVDLGTTTVVGYLMDLETGEIVATHSVLNPQVKFGEDLMTRISYTTDNENGKNIMQEKARNCVNKIIKDITEKAGIEKNLIYEVVLVGNTAMHHLFLGMETSHLAKSPYVPGKRSEIKVKSREAEIEINPSGYIYWLPVIAGWVGADNVGVLTSTPIYNNPEPSLVVDIGTNGEIAVGNEDRVLVTSTAAGPALEGAQIKYGMRAAEGAIEKVKISPDTLDPAFKTISDGDPVGVCGSGIIDVVAEMFKSRIIEGSGRFNKAFKDHSRIRKSKQDVWEYVLAWKGENATNDDIAITQKDIREVQKAKGAIQAGARVLMEKLGIDRLERIQLAGAFGNYINKKSALTIGLLPECDLEKIESIGNAAGEGAKLALMDKKKRKEAEKVPEIMEFFELAGTRKFNSEYMKAMYIPHKKPNLYQSVDQVQNY